MSSWSTKPSFLDQRLTTSYTNRRIKPSSSVSDSSTCSLSSSHCLQETASFKLLQWTKLRRLSSQIYSEDTRSRYGTPHCMDVSQTSVVVGFSRGSVLIYDLTQDMCKSLCGLESITAKVTAIKFSYTGEHVAAGFATGHILMWQLTTPSTPLVIIPPIHEVSISDATSDPNVAIAQLDFGGSQRSGILSRTRSGSVYFHSIITNLLGKRTHSTTTVMEAFRNNHGMIEGILDLSALKPLDKSSRGLDSRCLAALRTPDFIAIVSLYPRLKIELTLGESHKSRANVKSHMSWFRLASQNDSARLAFTVSATLSVVELTHLDSARDDEDQAELQFVLETKRKLSAPPVALKWFCSSALLLITARQELVVLDSSTLETIYTVDVHDRHMLGHSLLPSSMRVDDAQSSNPIDCPDLSLQVLGRQVFVMGRYEFTVGTLSTWQQVVAGAVKLQDPSGAIRIAVSYLENSINSEISGLPNNLEKRRRIIADHLHQLIPSLIQYSASRKSADGYRQTCDLIRASLYAVVAAKLNHEVLDFIVDHLHNSELLDCFCAEMLDCVSSGKISSLPPQTFKVVVQRYATLNKTVEVEHIIESLDPSTLDLNYAINICQKNRALDTLIHIWNEVFLDFQAPFIIYFCKLSGMSQVPEPLHSIGAFVDNSFSIYPYISYMLTGRAYPSGVLMNKTRSALARSTVYQLLLRGELMRWPIGSSPDSSSNANIIIHTQLSLKKGPRIFPYFCALLKGDSNKFFVAMTEAFEFSGLDDPNDHNAVQAGGLPVSRQLIVHIILEILRSSSDVDLNNRERMHSNIFLAHNYPKYKQFIILSESACKTIFDELIKYAKMFPEDKFEISLALESLLSIYRTPSIERCLTLLEESGLYQALGNLLRTERLYGRLAQLTLDQWDHQGNLSDVPVDIDLDSVISVLEVCLKSTDKESKTRIQVENAITEKFTILAASGTAQLAALLDAYSKHLHECIFRVENRPEIQLEYLRNWLFLCSDKKQKIATYMGRTRFISLCAKLAPEHHDTACDELFQAVLKLYSGTTDVDMSTLTADLQETKRYDIWAQLEQKSGNGLKALEILLDHLKRLELESSDGSSEMMLLKYANLASETALNLNPDERTKSQAMCIEFIQILLASGTGSMDLKERKEKLLSRLLTRLMEVWGSSSLNSVVKTTLGICNDNVPVSALQSFEEVKPLLGQIFSLYRHQYAQIASIVSMLEWDSSIWFKKAISEELRGWKVCSSEVCEGCGRKVLGIGIDIEYVYRVWAANNARNTKFETLSAACPDSELSDVLIVFRCGHAFHEQCLTRLGFSGRLTYECLICKKSMDD